MTGIVDPSLGPALERIEDPQMRILALRFYRFVVRSDLPAYSTDDLIAHVRELRAFAEVRPAGVPLVDIGDGRDPGCEVGLVVTDDMPFLVDSVTGELTREGMSVRQITHPQLLVRRDTDGRLLEILDIDVDVYVNRPVDAIAESWMRIEFDRDLRFSHADGTRGNLIRVLGDVRAANEDWQRMRQTALRVASELDDRPPPGLPTEEVKEGADFLRWLTQDNFTFLGYREYHLVQVKGQVHLGFVPGTGLGILRDQVNSGPSIGSTNFAALSPAALVKAQDRSLLVLTKANTRSTVHRSVYLDYFGVKTFDETGVVTGERRFLGLLTAAGLTESIVDVPVLRSRFARVMDELELVAGSHRARDLLQFLETYPREEFFQSTQAQIVDLSAEVLHLEERRQTRLFARVDDYGRFVSALVYLPRDRYTTSVRVRIEHILTSAFDGASVDYTAWVTESVLARLHYVVRMAPGVPVPAVDLQALERELAAATRNWEDDFTTATIEILGQERAPQFLQNFAGAFPEGYKEQFTGGEAVHDAVILDDLATGRLSLSLYSPGDLDESAADAGMMRFKLIRIGEAMSLSRILPTLQMMGVEVIDEYPFEIARANQPAAWILDFGLGMPELNPCDPLTLPERFAEGFRAVWAAEAQADQLNGLIVRSGLTWQQVAILRSYSRYLQQIGSSFSQQYIQQAMLSNTTISALLVRLFEAQFDPESGHATNRDAGAAGIVSEIEEALDHVPSLDQDKILRGLLMLIRATLRTNAYTRPMGPAAMAVKFDPSAIPDLPLPRPMFEIWVYSPRVEGVHLRFGPVARGGIRWSDRREDFRTEVLGLVKAQEVKNAVIVPVGAKGGFVPASLPDPAVDRDAWLTAGKAAYREFISGLLDLTDNLVDGEPVPPAGVIRRDGDDAYLVVAADKGTATFSDLANSIAAEYDFWLGDAFASGGSLGYDHKAMGITARGAWESVKRHFRELGCDTQNQDFTVVGVGDMGGDVFGNGMLLSEHIRLIAAFDHRHIIIDPVPDARTSFQERQRLFALPRSSWADYDPALISPGGGVFARSEKSIELSEQARRALGLELSGTPLAPNEVVRAILAAPVDLIWNGGIGTYVKAQTETNADVGDKSNDSVRINGSEIRARVVGEGGNLGLTQLGRVEAARAGVRLNTDAIDNSAGVDTSDHEVNIKIMLDGFVRAGELRDRDALLTSMTPEVADQVLADNYSQNVVLGNARASAPGLVNVHQRMIADLVSRGLLNRALEYLPDDQEMNSRLLAGQGLSSPELAVLLAYAKISLTAEATRSGLAENPWFERALVGYFPAELTERFGPRLAGHPLRREIISTVTCNRLINLGGITMVFRAMEETGATAIDVIRAGSAAVEVFGIQQMWDAINAQDNLIPSATQTMLHLETRRLLDRAIRWFLQTHGTSFDVSEQVARFGPVVGEFAARVPGALLGNEAARFAELTEVFVQAGSPLDLAQRVAAALDVFALLDIREIAGRSGEDVSTVMPLYFAVSERYDVDQTLMRITALPRGDRWNALARQALRSDLYGVVAALTARVIRATNPAMSHAERVSVWEQAHQAGLTRARSTLDEISHQVSTDLATLSVALRVMRNLVAQGGTSSAD